MIEFREKSDLLILVYTPQNGITRDDVNWIDQRIEKNGKIIIKNTFSFNETNKHPKDIAEDDSYDFDEEYEEFVIGKLVNDYFELDKGALGINHNLYLHKDMKLTAKHFVAPKNISIFQKIDNLIKEDIYIGGNHENSMPIPEFERLIDTFPNDYELRKYVEARVSAILVNYFDTTIDGENNYNRYMNKKISRVGKNLLNTFRENELLKYEAILDKIKEMLKNENSYNELQWQKEILQIILLLYPRYIYVFEKVPVSDTYNNKKRELDLLLVDSSGNADIIEIKRPFNNCIVTQSVYRDNFIPLKELSGTVMQIEKYIFYLNKWGKKGEDELTERYKDILPQNFRIEITNPKGIIIMGRENNLSSAQKKDFEIIKRKYSNIMDIITYDELISRLEVTIQKFKQPELTQLD
jgi:hypothetical protein